MKCKFIYKFNSQFVFILLVFSLLFISCGSDRISDQLLGSWSISMFIDKETAKRAFGDEMDPTMNLEMTLKSSEEFLKGGRYNSEGETTIRLFFDSQEIVLKLYIKESGRWEVYGKTLIQIAEDTNLVPLDKDTEFFLNSSPEVRGMFAPVKGQSVSYEIVSVSKNSLQMKSADLPGVVLGYYKK